MKKDPKTIVRIMGRILGIQSEPVHFSRLAFPVYRSLSGFTRLSFHFFSWYRFFHHIQIIELTFIRLMTLITTC